MSEPTLIRTYVCNGRKIALYDMGEEGGLVEMPLHTIHTEPTPLIPPEPIGRDWPDVEAAAVREQQASGGVCRLLVWLGVVILVVLLVLAFWPVLAK